MDPQQLKKNMEKFIGERVIILDPHPHAGHFGVIDRVEIPAGKTNPGVVVKLEDSNKECFVFNNTELMFGVQRVEFPREES